MFRSGLRVGEVAASTLAHLDLEARTLYVADTKNGRPRRPPLAADTLELLRAYLDPRRRGDGTGPAARQRRRPPRLGVHDHQRRAERRQEGRRAAPPWRCRRTRCGAAGASRYMADGGTETACMEIAGWTSNTMIVRYLADFRAEVAQADFDRVAGRQAAPNRMQRAPARRALVGHQRPQETDEVLDGIDRQRLGEPGELAQPVGRRRRIVADTVTGDAHRRASLSTEVLVDEVTQLRAAAVLGMAVEEVAYRRRWPTELVDEVRRRHPASVDRPMQRRGERW